VRQQHDPARIALQERIRFIGMLPENLRARRFRFGVAARGDQLSD
jgi:hypothetical protein